MRRSVRLPLSSRTADGRGDRHAAEKPGGPRRAQVDHLRFGDGTLWSFDGVEVAELSQEATPSIPIFRHTTADEGGRIAVIFLREGEAAVSHEGGLFRFSAGSAAFIAAGTTTSVEALSFCRVFVVSIPRAAMVEAGIQVAQTFGAFAYSTARRSPLLPFLSALVEVVENHAIPVEPTATVLRRLVADLFLLDEGFGVTGQPADLDVRAFTESLAVLRGAPVEESGMLSPRERARRAGFPSERDLHRAFKNDYGSTVRELLLRQASARAGAAAVLTPAAGSPADSLERASVRPGDRTG